MGGIYDTVFTEQQLEVKDEVAFMNAAKKKIPQLLRKYSSVHIKIGRWREDNRNRPDLTKLKSICVMYCRSVTWRRHIWQETLRAHGLRHGLLGHPDRSPPGSVYQYDPATRLGG